VEGEKSRGWRYFIVLQTAHQPLPLSHTHKHTHTITLLFPLSRCSQSQPAKTNTCAVSFSVLTLNLKNVCSKQAPRSSHVLLPSPYLREIKTDSFKFVCYAAATITVLRDIQTHRCLLGYHVCYLGLKHSAIQRNLTETNCFAI
jgi:hypothetical protein